MNDYPYDLCKPGWILAGILFVFIGCSSGEKQKEQQRTIVFSLEDFYSTNLALDDVVDSVFQQLDEKVRISQMIVVAAGTTGKPTRTVEKLIKNQLVGGVLMLSGEKKQLTSLAHRFDSLGLQHMNIPLIFSSDAEPSLFNRKIKGTLPVPKTVTLKTPEKCDSVARIISHELVSMKIRHNFAPVLDMSPNNEAITNRTFGNDSTSVVQLSSVFINASQKLGVAATAKHFPGHGLVSGDTHNQLVTIDGEMKEVENYLPLIDRGVISIMVGHIAVINNNRYSTSGLPSSCSKVIVTDLLKDELGFKGIVVTDAMNMGALRKIENASFKAVEAGCDMILMEPNEAKLHGLILNKYQVDENFRKQIDRSVRKILRLKACLYLL